MKEERKFPWAILVTVLMMAMPGTIALAQSSPGETRAAEEHEACPDEHPWTGKYHNYNYGFTITIPDKLKGFWNGFRCVDGAGECVCMQDHGRTIPLTDRDRARFIEVYAGYASYLDHPTLAQIVNSELRSLRDHYPKTLEIKRLSAITLAGVKGERAVVRYYDAKLKRWQREELVALWTGNEYLLYLVTPESNYMHDRKLFAGVVGSFVFTDDE
jgi:hypothetical protein